jgi:hypothetical protein
MDKREQANREWAERIGRIVAEQMKAVTQPEFVGCATIEIHGAGGQIKQAVAGTKQHHNRP